MKHGYILVAVLLLLAACKKKETSNNYTTVTASAYIWNPPGATGVFSATKNITYRNGDTLTGSDQAGAQFGTVTNFGYGGSILINGDTLPFVNDSGSIADSGSGSYYNFSKISFTSNTVTWNILGDNANNIPAFNYTDTTSFPKVIGFSVPTKLNAENGLTIHYTISGGYDSVYYYLGGVNYGASYAGGPIGSASFSTAQLLQAMQVIGNGPTPNAYLAVGILVVKFIPYTIGTDTFYFEKESNYTANAN